MDISQIVARKRQQIAEMKTISGLDEIRQMASANQNIALDFKAAVSAGHPSIVPMLDSDKGTTPVDDMLDRARQYGRRDKAKALALRPEGTFLTQELAAMGRVHEEASVPVVFMDWVIDEYQVYVAQLAEADALVLTACLMDADDTVLFVRQTHLCGMQAVMRCFTPGEVQTGCEAGADVILADLRTTGGSFQPLSTIETLVESMRGGVASLALTNVATADQAREAFRYGAQGVIPASAFMEQPYVKDIIRELDKAQ